MPKVTAEDEFDRLAWDTFLAAEVGIEDAISARAELVQLAGRVRSLCALHLIPVPDWVPNATELDHRAAKRVVRLGFWERKSEMVRAFLRRHGFSPPRECSFGRDEAERPYVVWGEEAAALGIGAKWIS